MTEESRVSEKPKPQGPPTVFFLIVAGLVGLALFVVMSSDRFAGHEGTEDPAFATPVVATRDVRFVKLEDDAVAVYDATTGDRIDTLLPGQDRFLQHVIDKYHRDRGRLGVDVDAPFRLTETVDGRISFQDLGTQRIIHNVRSFGSENVKAFHRVLHGLREPL